MKSRWVILVLLEVAVLLGSSVPAHPQEGLTFTAERREGFGRSFSYPSHLLQTDYRLGLNQGIGKARVLSNLHFSHLYGTTFISTWNMELGGTRLLGKPVLYRAGDAYPALSPLMGSYLSARGTQVTLTPGKWEASVFAGKAADLYRTSLSPSFGNSRYLAALSLRPAQSGPNRLSLYGLIRSDKPIQFYNSSSTPTHNAMFAVEGQREVVRGLFLVPELALGNAKAPELSGRRWDVAWKTAALYHSRAVNWETSYRFYGPDFFTPATTWGPRDLREWTNSGSYRWRTLADVSANVDRTWMNRHHDPRWSEGTSLRYGWSARVSPPRLPSLGVRTTRTGRKVAPGRFTGSNDQTTQVQGEALYVRSYGQYRIRYDRERSFDRINPWAYWSRSGTELYGNRRFAGRTTVEADQSWRYDRRDGTPGAQRTTTTTLGTETRIHPRLSLTLNLQHSRSRNPETDTRYHQTGYSFAGTAFLGPKTSLYLGLQNSQYRALEPYSGNSTNTLFTLRLTQGMGISDLGWSTVEGEVFTDLHRDGAWEAGEEGVPGVRIELPGRGEATTDTLGRFKFSGLGAGRHKVVLDLKTVPADLNPARPTEQTVASKGLGTLTVSFPMKSLGSISGFVFDDQDHDQRWDSGEPGVGGALVLLSGGQRSSYTASDGSYSFANLPSDQYRVEIDPANLPDDFSPTTAVTQTVALSERGRIQHLDFGVAERQRPVIKTIFPPTPAPPPQPVRPRVAPAPAPRPAPTTGPDEIKRLKSQARRLFLLEDYLGALQAWNKVLSLNPQDSEARAQAERARARLKKLGEKP